MSKNNIDRDLIPSQRYNGVMGRSRYATPESPFKEALRCITRQEPPSFVVGYNYEDLTEEQADALQEWACSAVVEAGFEWLTGIGTIEAAIHMVKCAEENGNIGTNPRNRADQTQDSA